MGGWGRRLRIALNGVDPMARRSWSEASLVEMFASIVL